MSDADLPIAERLAKVRQMMADAITYDDVPVTAIRAMWFAGQAIGAATQALDAAVAAQHAAERDRDSLRTEMEEWCTGTAREMTLMQEIADRVRGQLQAAEGRELALRSALAQIKTLGRVCPEFEICQHPACADSSAAWLIADAALAAPALPAGDAAEPVCGCGHVAVAHHYSQRRCATPGCACSHYAYAEPGVGEEGKGGTP